MRIIRTRGVQKAGLIAICLVAVITMMIMGTGLGRDVDELVDNTRYAASERDPSGRIALVAIDEKSLSELGPYPWKRSTHAELVRRANLQGAARVGFDVIFTTDAQDPRDDRALIDAIRTSKIPVGLAVATADSGGGAVGQNGIYPKKAFVDAGAETFSIWLAKSDAGTIRFALGRNSLDGKDLTTVSAWLSGTPAAPESYRVDWSIPESGIPTYSYVDVVKGRIPASELRGKSLLVGADTTILGDGHTASTGQVITGARAHIIAAETLAEGPLLEVGGDHVLAVTLLIVALLMVGATARTRYPVLLATLLALCATKMVLIGWNSVNIEIGNSLLVLVSAVLLSAFLDIFSYFFVRMTRNEGTGLSNLLAMKVAPHEKGSTIVLTIANHLDILAELGSEGRDKIMQKVAQRIEMGSNGRKVYQTDASTFAWKGTLDADTDLENAKNILVLMRNGVHYANARIDLLAHVGIDPVDRPVEKGVVNASIAATRAISRGIQWETYQEKDDSEAWRISVVSEVLEAIEKGQLWVAYQPKVSGATGRVTGAEALVRWKHPERGDVRPDAFIPLLEKANRTEELTQFMLESAIRDFSTLPSCTIAVNVSPLMVGEGNLLALAQKTLRETGFDPKRLTLEITESEKFTRPDAIKELEKIHALGVKISIDDYGMGNSTVNYLKVLPADELKIDRSFITNMMTNRSDSVVVASTIKLAHEMGLKVVAEGVENGEIQTYLRDLGCDFIQGYHTGKPVSFDEFAPAALESNGRRARRA